MVHIIYGNLNVLRIYFITLKILKHLVLMKMMHLKSKTVLFLIRDDLA